MPLAIPPELKPITAYIRRSEELDANKSDPNNRTVAYYCRSYAMEKAMNLGGAAGTESINTFLMALMQDLETSKPGISLAREEAKVVCEAHAVAVFHSADDEDRSGSENYREIARIFYNSSTFFDILEQFGPLDEEINSKRTYSKWKATEIMKALKEGRTPAAGGYGGDDAPPSSRSSSDSLNISAPRPPSGHMQDMSLGDGGGGGGSPSGFSLPPTPTGFVDGSSRGLPLPPSLPGSFQMPQQPQFGQPPPQQQYQQPSPPQQQYQQQQPPQQQYQQPSPPQQQYQQQQPPAPSPSLQPASHQPSPNYVAPPKTNNLQGNISDALELCAFAMAALKHNDTKVGRDRLREALNLLS